MVDDHLATALMLASQHIQTECVEELIRYGADVTLQDEYGMTALHYIGAFGDSDRDGGTIVRLLIESGCNPAIRDGFGQQLLNQQPAQPIDDHGLQNLKLGF